MPTATPTTGPTTAPTAVPTVDPTAAPTAAPTPAVTYVLSSSLGVAGYCASAFGSTERGAFEAALRTTLSLASADAIEITEVTDKDPSLCGGSGGGRMLGSRRRRALSGTPSVTVAYQVETADTSVRDEVTTSLESLADTSATKLADLQTALQTNIESAGGTVPATFALPQAEVQQSVSSTVISAAPTAEPTATPTTDAQAAHLDKSTCL